jgi:hypothetical protein
MGAYVKKCEKNRRNFKKGLEKSSKIYYDIIIEIGFAF